MVFRFVKVGEGNLRLRMYLGPRVQLHCTSQGYARNTQRLEDSVDVLREGRDIPDQSETELEVGYATS